VVPRRTPADVVEKLRAATVAAINTQKVRDRLQNEGAEPIGSSPKEFAGMMQTESKRWAEVIKAAAISVE
jgi:tripartite-type tricarboxylate transporter receptor subunit TctC